MVRKICLSTVAVAVLLALLLLAGGSWLLYSPAGTRWALQRITVWSGGELSIGRSEGTFGGALQLDEIKLSRPGLELQLGRLEMHNHLHGLLPLHLEVGRLHVDQLQIKTAAGQAAQTPQSFHWPQLPGLLGLLRIDLTDAELRNLSWQQDNRASQSVERLSGELRWQQGKLEVTNILLQTAALQASGTINCGFSEPQLKIDGQVSSRAAATSWRQLQLRANLQPGTAGQVLQGPVTLDLTRAQGEHLTATTELGLSSEQLTFSQLQLLLSDHPGKITASGSLRFSGAAPELVGKLQLDQLDLQAESGLPLQLSGSLQLQGGLQAYRGRFDLRNQGSGLTMARLAGHFSGDRQQLTLSDLQGEWLAGSLGGQVRLGWGQGWQVQAQLTGSGLDPQRFSPQLSGQLNLQLQGEFSESGAGVRSGQMRLTLHESLLHGQPLTGEAQLQLQGDVLRVEQLQLHGDGMQLQASGNPAERLTVNWQIDRLGQLLSEAEGRLTGSGWLRWRQQRLVTEFTATGEHLAFRKWRLDKMSLQAGTENTGSSWQLQLAGEGLRHPLAGPSIDRFTLGGQGAFAEHQLDLTLKHGESRLSASFHGGWAQQQWQGELTRFLGDDPGFGRWVLQQPTALLISWGLIRIEPLLLRSSKGSEIELHGSYQPASQQTTADLRWQALDLALLHLWLADWRISGQSSGHFTLEHEQQNALHGDISLSGELQRQQLRLKVADSKLSVAWDQQGLHSTVQLKLVDGGGLNGTLISSDPADFTWPRQAKLQLEGRDFPLEILQPWLPPELDISGKFGWMTTGSWQAGEPLNLQGTVHAGTGRFSWQEDEGVIGADIGSIDLSWQWSQRLQGKLALRLKENGSIESIFDLPLAATLPLGLDPASAMTAEFQARLQELGLLSIIFPGRIQESRGQLKLDLRLAGTVQRPTLQGDFHLFDGGAFIPAVGVQLQKIELQGSFADQRVQLAKLQLQSGAGQINGSGQLELRGWQPSSYRLQVKGENFQLINLPDLQVRANPDLQVAGTMEKVKVRGQVVFPEVRISGKQKTSLASASPDLQVVDREVPLRRQPRLQHDIDLQLTLGDRVLLNTAGIDAKLGGKLRLQSAAHQELAASGEIHVVKGKYSSYGVSLDISRGGLYFTGGPLDQPNLDILALRKVGEVQAGVTVTGTPRAPIVQLYSEPAMADTDILAYIVLGHPLGADRGQSGLLLAAAGALLSQGESVSLQDKLKNRLGLDVLDVSAGNGDVNSAIITTGKYLSPELYISLGYSLFSNTNALTIRYNLTPSWEIESNIGIESGVDMYYRIEIE